jgi:hypothetical protein
MLVLAGAAATLAAAAPASAQDAFGWLEGCWADETGATTEVWSREQAGLRFGYSVSRDTSGAARAFEQLRLDTTEGAEAYLAYPGGIGPTRFDAVMVGPGRALFANPDHDYPQVIDYAREGRGLVATISALDGENRVEYRYAPCPRGGL